MGEVLPMPSFGDLFTDLRGSDRTMRVSWHPERGAVVLSLWSGAVCRGSFRLAAADLPRLLSLLTDITAPAPDGPTQGAAPARPRAASAVEQTGEIDRPAPRGLLPIVAAPRVA
ncbi:hypothetical protein [Micromonospora sp. NPDC047730]|uniref:hypothetical protein n=1 Tax=Micromonospora sp. NPDC047730 TaxID=3364253 RepID=UPI00371F7F97